MKYNKRYEEIMEGFNLPSTETRMKKVVDNLQFPISFKPFSVKIEENNVTTEIMETIRDSIDFKYDGEDYSNEVKFDLDVHEMYDEDNNFVGAGQPSTLTVTMGELVFEIILGLIDTSMVLGMNYVIGSWNNTGEVARQYVEVDIENGVINDKILYDLLFKLSSKIATSKNN